MIHNGKRRLFGRALTDVLSVFEAMDKDKSGALSREEFERACKRLGFGLSAKQFDFLMEYLDADGDGMVSWAEFRDALSITQIDDILTQMGARSLRKGLHKAAKPKADGSEAAETDAAAGGTTEGEAAGEGVPVLAVQLQRVRAMEPQKLREHFEEKCGSGTVPREVFQEAVER